MQFSFSPVDADRLRNILSKKDKERPLKDCRRQFLEAAGVHGVSEEITGRMWDEDFGVRTLTVERASAFQSGFPLSRNRTAPHQQYNRSSGATR